MGRVVMGYCIDGPTYLLIEVSELHIEWHDRSGARCSSPHYTAEVGGDKCFVA